MSARLGGYATCKLKLTADELLAITVNNLSSVNHQLARTCAFVERNRALLPNAQVPTNQPFVYQSVYHSPVVKFPSPLVPDEDIGTVISKISAATAIATTAESLLTEFNPDDGLGLDSNGKLQLTVNKRDRVGSTGGDDAPLASSPLSLWREVSLAGGRENAVHIASRPKYCTDDGSTYYQGHQTEPDGLFSR